MVALAIASAHSAACGALDESASPAVAAGVDARDAQSSGPEPIDASSDAFILADHVMAPHGRQCAVGAAFASLTQVDTSGSSVESARLKSDQSAGMFGLCTDSVQGRCSIYVGARDGASFGSFFASALPDAGGYDGYPAVSSDALFMIFASKRPADAPVRLFSTPLSSGVSNGSVTPLPFPTMAVSPQSATQPYLLANGALYFVSNEYAAGTDRSYLYRSNDASAASVEGARRVDFWTAEDGAPVVSEDEAEIFYSKLVSHGFETATNGSQLWRARGVSTAQPGDFEGAAMLPAFPPSSPTDPVNHAHPVWLSPDACDLYVVIGAGSSDSVGTLWIAHR